MLLADVAVPVPLARALTYEVSAELAPRLLPGARVTCQLGSRKLIGVVLRVSDRPPPDFAVKPLGALLDAEPVLPPDLLEFLQEVASYYLAPVGEVLRLALPALEREQAKALVAQGELSMGASTKQVGGRRVAFARPTDAIEAPGSLRGQQALVLAALRGSGEVAVARLADRFSGARRAVERLVELGLATVEHREPARDPFFASPVGRTPPPELHESQSSAVARITEALDPSREGPRGFLLFGVTGSGKTEVYLRAIAACLARGRGALVMLPEIALTPQLVQRFRARFGDELAVLHSGLVDADRHAMWKLLRQGRVRVAIGARSALFAPVPDLGLVIVDEEHDGSFKQEEGVRYHARDMAILRAHRRRAALVLGSATPSLESVELARSGKLVELRLPSRAVLDAALPDVKIIDLRRSGPGPSGSRLLSLPLHRAIEETLARKEQVILFLNRRGFAPSVVCDACGHVETCGSCSVALTFHKGRAGSVRCHYCDFRGPLPSVCSACAAPALELEGLGTEQLEGTVAAAFPGARVARLDRDVASGARAEAIIERMREGGVDILVGTQMVTKGHDLPRVTLVGVLNADSALSLPDFRAAERGFQLLVQVAGRAGRGAARGRVLVQTRSPEHAAIVFAARHDVSGFLGRELVERKDVGYPPFARLALLRVDAAEEHDARRVAGELAAAARTAAPVRQGRADVLGPSAAPLARLRGRYRFRVMLRAPARPELRAVLAVVREAASRADRRVHVVIDVDPVSML